MATSPAKDFSFLLAPDIYHPLQPAAATIPAAFRSPAVASKQPSPATPLPDLIATGHFRAAAISAAQELTNANPSLPPVDPTDHARIFALLHARLACLTLVGGGEPVSGVSGTGGGSVVGGGGPGGGGPSGTALAAQEARALQDLGSAFYYADPQPRPPVGTARAQQHLAPTALLSPVAGAPLPSPAFPAPSTFLRQAATVTVPTPAPALPEHLVPWDLRVLAVRLSSLGFGDARRSVMAYHDLARECRSRIAVAVASGALDEDAGQDQKDQLALWKHRLLGIGIRVASALVEMGDLQGAAELLRRLDRDGSSKWGDEEDAKLRMARALLWLHLGDVTAARQCVAGKDANENNERDDIVLALADMADGEYDSSLRRWRELKATLERKGVRDEMVDINLAVCLLYVGRMAEVRWSTCLSLWDKKGLC